MLGSRLSRDRSYRSVGGFVARLALAAAVSLPAKAAEDPQKFPQISTQEAQKKYDGMIGRLAKGDWQIDYTELRITYAFTKDYDPYSVAVMDPLIAAAEAANKNDCKLALKKAAEVLRRQFINIGAHLVRRTCFEKTNDKLLEAERAITRGLGESVLESGDGKSPKSAYVVVTLEEQSFVLAQLGLLKGAQALVDDDGHKYDLITGKDEKTGDEQSVYFNIDLLFAGMTRKLMSDQAPGSGGD
jgi:hypothetical protein